MCRLQVVALLLLLLGCKAEASIDDYPCPPSGTKLTYDSFGSSFLAENCQTCHGQQSSERKGAPSSFDFGTIADVRAHKARIFARAAAENVTMPPGPDDPPAAARHELAEWLACGAP